MTQTLIGKKVTLLLEWLNVKKNKNKTQGTYRIVYVSSLE